MKTQTKTFIKIISLTAALFALVAPGQAFAAAKSKVRLTGLPYVAQTDGTTVDVTLSRAAKNGKANSNAYAQQATVALVTTDGTAKRNADYTAPASQNVIFPACTGTNAADCMTQTVHIAISHVAADSPKSFTVTVKAVAHGNAVPVNPYSARVFILEPATGTGPQTPHFILYEESAAVSEGDVSACGSTPAPCMTAWVIRTDNLQTAASVSVKTENGPAQTGHGVAVGGTSCAPDDKACDYITLASQTLSFNPAQAGYSPVSAVPVAVSADKVQDDNPLEDFSVVLSDTGGTELDREMVTILDDEGPASFFFQPTPYTVLEGQGVQAIAWATGNFTPGATVDYQTSGGTATEGSDYPAASGQLGYDEPGFEPIDLSASTDNIANEGNERFYVDLSNAAGGTVTANGARATITIVDMTPQPVATVGGVTVVRNGDGSVTVGGTVTLSGPSATDVTVSFQIIDPATGAVLGTGTVTIPAGQTSGTFTITLTPGQIGNTQTIVVVLTSDGTSGATIPAGPGSSSGSTAVPPGGNGGGNGGGSNTSTSTDTSTNTVNTSTDNAGTTGGDLGNQLVLGARQSACGLVVSAAKMQKVLKQKGLILKMRSGQSCKVALATTIKQLKLRQRKVSHSARALRLSGKKAALSLQPGKARTVKVTFTKKTLKAIKKALRARNKKLVATVVVSERSGSAAAVKRTLKITIKR